MLIHNNILALTISIYDLAKRWNASIEEILKRARNSILTLCIYADELLALEIPSYSDKQKQINKMVSEGIELHAARVVFIEAEKELRKQRPDLSALNIFNRVSLTHTLVAILPRDIASFLAKKEVQIEQVTSLDREITYQLIPKADAKLIFYIDKRKSVSISCSDLRITKEEVERIEKENMGDLVSSTNETLVIPLHRYKTAQSPAPATTIRHLGLVGEKNSNIPQQLVQNFISLLIQAFPANLGHAYLHRNAPHQSEICRTIINYYKNKGTKLSFTGLSGKTVTKRFRESSTVYNSSKNDLILLLHSRHPQNVHFDISSVDQGLCVTLILLCRGLAEEKGWGTWSNPDYHQIAKAMLICHNAKISIKINSDVKIDEHQNEIAIFLNNIDTNIIRIAK